MSLSYAVQYKVDGVLKLSFGSHPTCFGMLSSASDRVPKGATLTNVIYISTCMGEADFLKAYAELVKVLPTVTINGRAVGAPKATFYRPNSRKFGNARSHFLGNHVRTQFQKGTLVGETYPLIKVYFKALTRPKGGSHHTCEPVASYFAAGRDVFKGLGRPFNPLYVLMAMGLSSGLLGYRYPHGAGPLYKDVLQRYLKGDIQVSFDVTYTDWNHKVHRYDMVYEGARDQKMINVSYLPGGESSTFVGTLDQSAAGLADGTLVQFHERQNFPTGSVDNIKSMILRIIELVG